MSQVDNEQCRTKLFNQVLKFRPGKVALLIVDMQKGFLAPGAAMEVPAGRGTIANIRYLVNICREARAPIVYTRFIYSPGIPTLFGDLHVEHKPVQPGIVPGPGQPSNCCLEGDESAEVIAELAPQADDLVIDKHGYDGFHESPLDSALRAKKIENLIVTGVMTDICVLATVAGATHHGYKVTVVRDGVATLWPEIQEASLDIIQRAYARVISADQAVVEMQNACSKNRTSPPTQPVLNAPLEPRE